MNRFTHGRVTRLPAPPAPTVRLVAALALAIVSAACDVHGVSDPGTVRSLTISPDPQSVAVNGTQQFSAVAMDASGATVSVSPTWSIVAGGGTITSSGLFTAGTTPETYTGTVRATLGGLSSTATVIVTNGPLATLTVTPSPDTLAIRTTQQFAAVGRDAAGNVVAVSPIWSVASGGGSIDAVSGRFTAGTTSGTYANTVRASVGDVAGFATVTVTSGPLAAITVTPSPDTLAVGASRTFAAVGTDASGNAVPITPTWSVAGGGGSIDAGTGVFTAGADTGTFASTVRATSGSVVGTATVTVVSAAPSPIVALGAAEPNGIMAGTAFTCVSGGRIEADIAISPGSTVTGFPPCVITGVQHLADAVADQAQIDLTSAYNTLAGLPCPPANAIVADLGGTTKPAGVYCTASGIGVTGILTLDGGGDPNATFVFQAGTELTTAGDVVLINGAQAKNVYWQVGSSATIGTASQWKGNVIALTSITLVDNANLLGRALARNGAVSLGTGNVITLP